MTQVIGEPPSAADLSKIAKRLGLPLAGDEPARYAHLLAPFWEAMAATERAACRVVDDDHRPVVGSRAWRRPAADENPLNAWTVLLDILDPDVAAGPLSGRTVAIKDNIALARVPMSNGSALLADYVPQVDATAVGRVLAAGGRIIGKAECEDMCMSGSSHTSASGPVRNPWDPRRVTGGSSSGCGALVADGAADVAIGSDQGGSVRLPAGWCGVLGLKPTWGLIPFTGAASIDVRVDHLGVLTRSVEDAALALDVLAGPDDRDPRQVSVERQPSYARLSWGPIDGLRIGLLRESFGGPGADPEVEDVVRDSVRQLGIRGARVLEVSLPEHREFGMLLLSTIFLGAARQIFEGDDFGTLRSGQGNERLTAAILDGLTQRAGRLAPNVKMQLLGGRFVLDRYGGLPYAFVERLRGRVVRAYDELLAHVDVLALPTQATTAPPIPPPDAPIEESIATAWGAGHNTVHFNVTGHPALSMPAGLVSGLPVGTMLVGRHGDDATLLRVAAAWEAICDGFPIPPSSAPITLGVGQRFGTKR